MIENEVEHALRIANALALFIEGAFLDAEETIEDEAGLIEGGDGLAIRLLSKAPGES